MRGGFSQGSSDYYTEKFTDDWRARRAARGGSTSPRRDVGVGDSRPCLDYCSKKSNSTSSTALNRVRVFRDGEIESRTVTKQPPGMWAQGEVRGNYGHRISKGVSSRGRRFIRRSVSGYVATNPGCQPHFITITSQKCVSDEEFKGRLESWLAWLRKYWPDGVKDYALVFQVQPKRLKYRGERVLHAHMMIFQRMPREVMLKARGLLADVYGLGAGAFDIKRVRRVSRAAAYLARYMTREPGADADLAFRGNAYSISRGLRSLAGHVAEYFLPWGHPAAFAFGCGLRGGIIWAPSRADALSWLGSVLALPDPSNFLSTA